MAHVAISQRENPEEQRTTSIVRMAETQKSDAHISQLLAIANHSMQLLVKPDALDDKVEIDPASQEQARKTYELVHIQLRNLIDEPRRWTLESTEHEKESSKLIDSTVKLYDAKIATQKSYNRPSTFLRPKVRLFTVGWIAWTGDGPPTQTSLHGRGSTPAEALKNFDEVYYDIEELRQEQAAELSAATTEKAPPAKTPKKKKAK